MDVRNKIITILDTADIRFDILEDRNLRVSPNNCDEYDFLCKLFWIVRPNDWHPTDGTWVKDHSRLPYFDPNGNVDCYDEHPEYVMVEFE